MPKKQDIDKPPEMLNISTYSKIKKLLASFFKPSSRALHKLNHDVNINDKNIIIKNFESFYDKIAEDVMIPRADIIAVKHDISLSTLSKTIIESAHTRTLIYKENLDNIIGFIHIKDLFEIIARSKKYNLKKLIRKHIVAPHSMKLVDLLKQMQVHRTHIAVVIDEYGGTDGIVTIEDIIESIVGRIDDEHDTDLKNEDYKMLKPGLLLVSARMEVEELEKILALNLRNKDDEFDTIGGLVLAKVGHVPEQGLIVDITDQVTVEVMDATPRTIKQLKVIYKI